MAVWKNLRVLVTGGNGFLGKWVCRELINAGCAPENIRIPKSRETDLRVFENCKEVCKDIDVVFHLAGRDGGLGYNREHPGSIFYDNAIMNIQMMEAARISGVDKYVFAGSAAAYPETALLPLCEADFWNGYPNRDNAAYCLAKKISLVQAVGYHEEYGFSTAHLLLTNMYGPGDVFDPARSRVAASLIRKFTEARRTDAKEVVMWGSGNATRELLYVEDAARAFRLAAERCNTTEPINIGSGLETSIRDLAETVAEVVGYTGTIVWDTTKPEGQMRRCSDVSRAKAAIGFKAETPLRTGIEKTVAWYLSTLK